MFLYNNTNKLSNNRCNAPPPSFYAHPANPLLSLNDTVNKVFPLPRLELNGYKCDKLSWIWFEFLLLV